MKIIVLEAVHMRTWVRLGGLAHQDEMIFIPCSYGTFYLTSKSFLGRWKKRDCFEHEVFRREFFYFQ